ncbi:MAG: phosphoribosylaminoimidazole succinocarboxamide synthase [Burkholderiaceae bacterium]|nr:MAG: phosphoribosylaminoimidazole succinocarboxamide synthase [Burkholderiaceae bacterium]
MTQNLIYTGSVKDVYTDADRLIFSYSDRYSVFDWGQMPDDIPGKGQALASLAASFFEFLQAQGIPSHYLGQTAPNAIAVQPVDVLRPAWTDGLYDYSAYRAHPTGALVPLEVIFRHALALGNSLEGRLKKDPAYMRDLGLTQVPTSAAEFDPPLVEFSTKLESTDRYVTAHEIEQLDLLSASELSALREKTRHIATLLRGLFEKLGVKLWDGKFEFACHAGRYPQREFLLVDSVGPDELRLTYDGLSLSKEFLRQIYTNTAWAQGMRQSKALAKERHTREWKAICIGELGLRPRHLTAEERDVASLLYQALANEVAGFVGRALPFDAAIRLPVWREHARRLVAQAA